MGARSLGYDVMGCVYDVIGKPRHDKHLATPVDLRRYTQQKFKACPSCKRKSSGPAPHAIQIGNGEVVYCEDGRVCTDEGGRLYAGQRDTDETVDEFRARLFEVVSAEPDKWVNRAPVVRLETEEVEAGIDAWQIGRLIREAQLGKRWPRNPDACQRYGRMCSYWPLCTRMGTTHDYTYKRPHSELALVEEPDVQG